MIERNTFRVVLYPLIVLYLVYIDNTNVTVISDLWGPDVSDVGAMGVSPGYLCQ